MENDSNLYASMQTGKAFKVYRKTIPAIVELKILNPFDTTERTTVQLSGNPHDAGCHTCFVELWSEKEHVFFERANRYHLENGFIIEHTQPISKEIEKTPDNMSDEEIDDLVTSRFLTLRSKVLQMTSIAAVQRVLDAAEMANRPEKTVAFLRERLAVVQSGELDGGNDSD